jgi:hypothetical protein
VSVSVRADYDRLAGKLWSGSFYGVYKSVEWSWVHLPFHSDFTRPRAALPPPPASFVSAKGILEVGSAMGQAYRFLRDSGLIDVSDYVGCDVSEDGQAFCRATYPEAHWEQGDFSKRTIDRRFEYAYERHSVHHMPEPLAQYKKILAAVDRAVCFTFRGRVRGETISDLERSYFNHTETVGFAANGRVFMNQINVMEAVALARTEGFNHIGIRVGVHEPVQTEDPRRPGYYMTPAVKAGGGELLRFNLLAAKEPRLGARTLSYVLPGQRKIWLSPDFHRLRRLITRL